jgi:hypothetical protein
MAKFRCVPPPPPPPACHYVRFPVLECPVETVTVFTENRAGMAAACEGGGSARRAVPHGCQASSTLSNGHHSWCHVCFLASLIPPVPSLPFLEVTRCILLEDLSVGLHAIEVPRLSAFVDADSMRVKGEGAATILEVGLVGVRVRVCARVATCSV